MQIKRWNVANYDEGLVKKLAQSTNLPLMVCKVLSARNSNATPEEISNFLNNQVEFESPFNLKDMDLAVKRIFEAVEKQEKIIVYGDYDCDGITSTALLLNYFQSIGADTSYYIPHRKNEGYGMNRDAVDYLNSIDTSLIITVDNGISSHAEVDYANSLGIDTVITDHHTPRETLPNAVAVVNPHRLDCPSKFKDYAGVGVAFQLICALEDAEPTELLDYYADLVAIGTVADLVTLSGENRTIVSRGIENIREGERIGVNALLEAARIKPPITAESISFGISPRINAAGRIGNVDEVIELLITEDNEEAQRIANSLGQLNMERRGIEENVLSEINAIIKENPEILLERVLIVSGENWHQGVMGIVASRLMDRFGKPTIVFSLSDGAAKGSGRSIKGFSLIEAITACNKRLTHYGGHTLAAGMTILEEHLDEFNAAIQKYAYDNYEIMPVPVYDIDCEIEPKDLSIEHIKSFDSLAPFGAGNPSPIFLMKNLTLTGIFPTADEKHMRLNFKFGEQELSTIFFRMTPERFPYSEGTKLDAVVEIDINEWNGNLQLSTKIKDIRPIEYPQEQAIVSSQMYEAYRRGEKNHNLSKSSLLPTRDDLEIIYKYLRASKTYPFNRLALWENLMKEKIDLAKLEIAVDIFIESGLLSYKDNKYSIVPHTKKIDIKETKSYKKLAEL